MATHTTEFQPVTTVPIKPHRISEVSDPHTVVAYLRDVVGLSARELAEATGAEERSVRRWASQGTGMQPRYVTRLDDLRVLAMLLAGTLPSEQTGRWLRARNLLLKGARPLDLLAQGEFQRVYDAAEAFVDGDPI